MKLHNSEHDVTVVEDDAREITRLRARGYREVPAAPAHPVLELPETKAVEPVKAEDKPKARTRDK